MKRYRTVVTAGCTGFGLCFPVTLVHAQCYPHGPSTHGNKQNNERDRMNNADVCEANF